MDEKQIEMMSKIKEILNDAGYSLSVFNLTDEHIGNMKYISVIEMRAKEKRK